LKLIEVNGQIKGNFISLESKLHWTASMEDQIALVENFLHSYGNQMSNFD
jgi:hypothetical protein